MWLPDETFKSVIQHTPLISIDLIIRNENDEVLLGKRVNAPAKGYWFVPGGRIRKNETLNNAFVRLVREELGIESGMTRADAKFLGVFEHFYKECFFNKYIETHYVVLGYELKILGKRVNNIFFHQHSSYKFFSCDEASNLDDLHKYTKVYLNQL